MDDIELLPKTDTLNFLLKENSDLITQLVVTGYLSTDHRFRQMIASWIDVLQIQSVNAVTYYGLKDQSYASQSLLEL